ncbi:MAG TPA: OmpA family protein [Bradyrhizobium sp.]|nr:OmpA family protein [Bradyrhizobium sp.]
MTKLRLVLLATTALTAMQFASTAAHAQSAPIVVAQAKEELGPDGKPKQPPKGAQPPAKPAAPPAPAKPAAPPPPPPAAKPPAPPPPPPAPPRPAAPPPPPPPHAAPPPPPPPHVAPPPPPPPPPAAKPATPPPPPPPAAKPATPPPPPPPAAAPARPTPPPTATPQTSTPPAGGPQGREERREHGGQPPAAGTPPAGAPGTAPTTAPPPGRTQQTPGTAPTQAAPQVQPAPAAPPSPPPAGGALREERREREGRPGTPPPGGTPPAAGTTPPTPPPANAAAPSVVPGAPNAAVPPGRVQNTPPTVTPAFRRAPTVTAPLPSVPPAAALTPIAPGAAPQGPRRMEDFRAERREVQEGGRTVIVEPGRIIVRDPSGQEFVRHNEMDRFRFGARDIRTQTVGGESRTIVVRPDGTEVITVIGADGQLLRRMRRDPAGREIVIIDNSYRDPLAVGGFFVDLPPPVVRIPYDRYIVDYDDAPPELVYDTLVAPPVDRIERRYSLDEIRFSPNVRMLMPSIDVNTINFDLGSWEIPPDQAVKLQAIADGLNRAIQRNPREVFLIEGHTDATGNDTDNLSLSDRRAESAAELLTQQFGVPAENLTSQGYGSQYLKEQTDGPSRINRRVTVRRITPLLNGNTASLPPPPPGIAPPR